MKSKPCISICDTDIEDHSNLWGRRDKFNAPVTLFLFCQHKTYIRVGKGAKLSNCRTSFYVTDETAISLLENEHVGAGNQQNKSYLKVVGLSESAWVMFVNQMRLCLCCREVVRKLVREFEEVQKLEELHSVIHDSFYRYEPLGYLLLLETSLIVLNSLRIIVELKSDVMNMIHLTAFFNTVIL
ncbi:hypothetical protein Peur_023676 [Populus x canadensis]